MYDCGDMDFDATNPLKGNLIIKNIIVIVKDLMEIKDSGYYV